jgi:hypothetical protein
MQPLSYPAKQQNLGFDVVVGDLGLKRTPLVG